MKVNSAEPDELLHSWAIQSNCLVTVIKTLNMKIVLFNKGLPVYKKKTLVSIICITMLILKILPGY